MTQIVRLSDVGSGCKIRATNVIDATHRGWDWCEQDIRRAYAAGGGATNTRSHSGKASKIELATRPRWGNPGKMQPLVLKASFKAVPTIDLGQILRKLNGVADPAVRTCKRACAEPRQPADTNCRQPTVLGGLRNSLNTKLRRDSADE